MARSLYVAGDISPEEIIGSLIMQEEHDVQVIRVNEDNRFTYHRLEQEAETPLTEYEQEVVGSYMQGNSVAVIGGNAREVSAFIKELLKNPVTKEEGLVVVCGYSDNTFSDTLSQISKLEEDLANMQFIVGICEDTEDMKDFVIWHNEKPYYDVTKITELFPYLHTTVHIRNGQCVPWLDKEDTDETKETEEEEEVDCKVPVHIIEPSFPKVDMRKLKEKFCNGKRFVVTGGTLGQRISFVTYLQKEGIILGSREDTTFACTNLTTCDTAMVHVNEDVTDALMVLELSPQNTPAVSLLEANETTAHKLAVHWVSTETNGCMTVTPENINGIVQYLHEMGYRNLEIVKIEEDK